jgi:hypothetical protein
MNDIQPSAGAAKSPLAFQLFKYIVYSLLAMNVYHFFVEDYSASDQTFAAGIAIEQIIEAFTATIDTAAWVILLLLFELETYVLEDDKIKGTLKWTLHLTRALCYGFIVYSFYGYISKYIMLHTILPFTMDDACTLVGSSFTYVEDIDEYLPLTVTNCSDFNGQSLIQIAGTDIIATGHALVEAQRLSLTEVINSANWLVIVIILEVDVFLQSRGSLQGLVVTISKGIKVVLYSVLFLAAVYWGVKGDFLDFWDAFLWLVAFVFIEMNIFEWHKETSGQLATGQDTSDSPGE